MTLRSTLRQALSPIYRNSEWLKGILRETDVRIDLARHSMATVLPQIIQPKPRRLFVSLTANCNLRCKGCHYGRDFMPGHQLPWSVGEGMLDDAKELGFEYVRLYGGEPLIHKDIVKYVEHIHRIDMTMKVTTNGVLLKEKVDDLYEAGLRQISCGFYGVKEQYNKYVQRPDQYQCVEAGVAYARERYGKDELLMHLDWLLMRPTCTLESLQATLDFARRYDIGIYVNLLHYSLPYFVQGDEEQEIQFHEEDHATLRSVVDELLKVKEREPDLLLNSVRGLRSIPDWLIKGPNMKVPCTEYSLIWVGPDGTVQMCYVTFELGNLHEKRLSEMLFTKEHCKASQDAFALNCPNCHCSYDARIQRHAPSRRAYA